MSQAESLRNRMEQHKPKNDKSKPDDKTIYRAMGDVTHYLMDRFDFEHIFSDYEIVFQREIKAKEMIEFIRNRGIRAEFDFSFFDRGIVPDGGVLFLQSKQEKTRRPLLFAEIKRQGTNDAREQEGKGKQATGNAIERLGKNLSGIRAMMNQERITPFVCFGWGCDFAPKEKTVLAKVSMMNEFYPLNHTYVFKRDGNAESNRFAPVSMYFREEPWSREEMFEIMKEIAETALRYYLF